MRRPVQVMYGGAHLYRAGLVEKMGRLALGALDESLGSPEVMERVRSKLEREPVEDYRIDFEDGFGERGDAEEDAAAEAAGREFAQGGHAPFTGIRIKAEPVRGRRTLELFLDAAGRLPERFVVTLPKVHGPAEVEAFLRVFPALRIEVMAETPGAIRAIRDIVGVARDRLAAVHFGPYDFIASCGVPGPFQRLSHPLCDWARHTLVAALADTGIPLADGPTTILPVGAEEEIAHARALHAEGIRRALECGIYQGWDLHPAQLPVRYATLYSFFREHLAAQRQRLENYLERQAQATRVGAVFDDAATARGLIEFFERARSCGAIDAEEAPAISPSADPVSP